MENITVLSVYETFLLNGREVTRIIAQGMATQERKVKLKARALQATLNAISNGRYDYQQEVYEHPINARKPYLDKYKAI